MVRIKLLLLVTVIALCAEPRLLAQGEPVTLCGTTRLGIEAGCALLETANHDSYELDNYDGPMNTQVKIDGELTLSCMGWCMAGACVNVTGYSVVESCTAHCCVGTTGNIDGDLGDVVDISDLTSMVGYLFSGGMISICPEENDVDKSGALDISDLSVLVDFLFGSGTLPNCP